MDTQRFTEMIQKLQELQIKATLKGIHSFDITSRYDKSDPELGNEPDEYSIMVYIFKAGDDSEGDYGRFDFWESETPVDWYYTYIRLKFFIEEG